LNQVGHSAKREELMQLHPDHLPRVRDQPSCAWDSKRILLLRSVYCKLNEGTLRCLFAKAIWRIKMPLKLRVFLWLVINGAILT